jgi:hypothetical protein
VQGQYRSSRAAYHAWLATSRLQYSHTKSTLTDITSANDAYSLDLLSLGRGRVAISRTDQAIRVCVGDWARARLGLIEDLGESRRKGLLGMRRAKQRAAIWGQQARRLAGGAALRGRDERRYGVHDAGWEG